MIDVSLKKMRQLFRSSAFESEEHVARGTERNRRALLTGGVATLARVVQIGTSLITIPLTLKYLGNERFGLWMTISSVLAMASFADFGVGNGVLNTVAKAFGQDDMTGVRKAVSSGFAVLCTIAALTLAIFFSIYREVNWADFFRVSSPQARLEAGPALAVFATCFSLNIAMDVIQRVQLGIQEGYRYSLWQLVGSLSGLVGVLCAIHLRASLPFLVAAAAGAPVIATVSNAIHFFGVVRRDLRPSWLLVSRESISRIAKLGGMFFVLQVVSAISFSADNFIIARTLGAVHVPDYSIPQRIFSLVTTMSGMLIAPLWPAYGEAISRGDISWVRHTLRHSMLIVFGVTLFASLFLLPMSSGLIHLWVGSRIHPPFILLLGLAIWTVISACADALSVFMNGAEVLRFQVIIASMFGFGCILTKVLFVRTFGIQGLPWATILAYSLLSGLPCAIYLPVAIRRLGLKAVPAYSVSTIRDIERAAE